MKDIKGYEGKYAVTEDGQIFSYKSNRFLKPSNNGNGYFAVSLCSGGTINKQYVHRLVAEAFLPNPEGKIEVNHINEDKSDNSVSNLEWVTHKENINHGTRNEKVAEAISKPVYCVELNMTFPSLTAAADEFGISKCTISHCLNGRQKTAGGFHWKFAAVYENLKESNIV